jgi:hypothetical protein
VKTLPEPTDEELIAVRDDFQGQSILAEPAVKKYLCKFLGCHRGFARPDLEVTVQSIGHGHYTVIAFIHW